MKTTNYLHSRGARSSRPPILASRQEPPRSLWFGSLLLSTIVALSAHAQIQQAWVARYNNGITSGTNQAVKMALDTAGNIYVTGFSQNTNGNLGYVTIKYAPNGNQLWASRYDSTNFPNATPTGLVLDNSNNVVVTGSAVTVKYDSNGNQLWTAPYGGNAIAMDTNGNSIVIGYASAFSTVKLNPQGSNIWFENYPNQWPVGPEVSQAVVVDNSNNVYVAGENTYNNYRSGEATGYYVDVEIVKYSQNGTQLWTAENFSEEPARSFQVVGLVLDHANNVYVEANTPGGLTFQTAKYSSDGLPVWTNLSNNSGSPGQSLAVDGEGNVILSGQGVYAVNLYGPYYFLSIVYKLNNLATTLWTNYYPLPPIGTSAANAMSVDSVENIFVTGYGLGTNANNGILTLEYNPNGNLLWKELYSSLSTGNAAGNAIAVDGNGNVYVTGYETLPGGGTGIVTIKYSPVVLQHHADGSVILQAQGSPGESFDIQASTDLQSWLDLGPALADTNGLMQFNDTNAPNYPSRFYHTNPQ